MALDFLPDSILIKILQYLDVCDLCCLSKVSNHFSRLSCDRFLVKNSHFEGGYSLDDAAVRLYISSASTYIQRLDFSHCHWLSASTIAAAVRSSAAHLVALLVVECRLRADALVSLLASLSPPCLTELSFSVASFIDLRRDVFASAAESLSRLRSLSLFYTSRELSLMSYVGEHPTLIDLCPHLERLYVGAPGMAIPELFRPLISSASPHLHTFALTPHMHAGAQMLFYGLLAQLPHKQLAWQTLLMPNVNVGEFSKRHELAECLRYAHGSLRELDISGSRVRLPNDVVAVTSMPRLEFLGLARTATDGQQVALIAAACRQLVSINLFGCCELFSMKSGNEARGIVALFENCKQLRLFNIGDEHHHTLPPGGALVCEAIYAIKGLHGLCMSTCMLTTANSTQQLRHSKRMWTCPRSGAAKRRCVETSQQANSSSSSPSSDIANTSVLQRIVRQNPELRELEVIAAKFESAFHRNKFVNPKKQQFTPCKETGRVTDIDLTPISQLTCLHTLTLIGIPGLSSGECLRTIADCCQRLQRFSIGFLGNSLCTTSLAQALERLTELEDFRLEQPYINLGASLFDGLSCCRRLRRLCIIAKNSTFEPKLVEGLIDKLSKLSVLQLYATSTFVTCKRLSASLNRQYAKDRPALNISIYPLFSDGIAKVIAAVPSKHFDELTRFYSRVCSVPASCRTQR